MAAFGALILVIVAVVAVTIVGGGGDAVRLEPLGLDINTTGAGVFGVGAGSAAVGALGLYLLLKGLRRSAKRRQEVRELRRDAGREPDGTPAPTAPEPQPESPPPRRRGDDEGAPPPGAPRP